MLHSSKVKRTPEARKKAQAKEARRIALQLYPHFLMQANAQSSSALKIAIDSDNMESAHSIRNLARIRAAELAIDSVEPFLKVWKKKKGFWLHDDA